jgi:hypothetical protein
MAAPALRIHADKGDGPVVDESLADGVILKMVQRHCDEVVQLRTLLHQAQLGILRAVLWIRNVFFFASGSSFSDNKEAKS